MPGGFRGRRAPVPTVVDDADDEDGGVLKSDDGAVVQAAQQRNRAQMVRGIWYFLIGNSFFTGAAFLASISGIGWLALATEEGSDADAAAAAGGNLARNASTAAAAPAELSEAYRAYLWLQLIAMLGCAQVRRSHSPLPLAPLSFLCRCDTNRRSSR